MMAAEEARTWTDENGDTWYLIGEKKPRLSRRPKEERDQLYHENEKLVFFVLGRCLPARFQNDPDYDDVVQEMKIILLRSIELWRPEKGELSTYCCTSLYRRLSAVRETIQRAKGRFQLEIDIEDLAEAAPDWDELYAALDKLRPRERDMLIRGYGLRCEKVPVTQLAREYGIRRQRVHQIQVKALEKLQRLLSSSSLSPPGASEQGSSPRFSVLRCRQSRRLASDHVPRRSPS